MELPKEIPRQQNIDEMIFSSFFSFIFVRTLSSCYISPAGGINPAGVFPRHSIGSMVRASHLFYHLITISSYSALFCLPPLTALFTID